MANSPSRNSEKRGIPAKVVSEFTLGADELRHHRIAEKAYELFECRGCCHGRDLDDWLEAERSILSEVTAPKNGTAQNPRPRGPRAINR